MSEKEVIRDNDDSARKMDRSPSFPFISLKKAIQRAEQLSSAHQKIPARLRTIAPTWGYGEKSSGLNQTVAALKQYGLLEDVGSKEERKVFLSDLAWKILKDERTGEREKAVKEAALKPRLIAEYAVHWQNGRPSDSHCVSELHLDRGFTEVSAKSFINIFDETISYAKIDLGDTMSSSLQSEDTETDRRPESVQDEKKMEFQPQPNTTLQKRGVNRATFPIPEGNVALEFPDNISPESIEELESWFELIMKRAKRGAL